MIMKKIRNILVIGLSILICGFTLQSCSLVENLEDTSTLSDIKTIDDLDLMTLGMYSQLNRQAAFKVYGFYMLAMAGDDLIGTQQLGFGDKSHTGNQTSQMWNSLYSTIGRANTVLQLADKIHVAISEEATKDQYRGEAYFLRAFCYYYLVQMFGAVPMRLEPLSEHSNFYAPRVEVERIYQQIFEDLAFANLHCLPVDQMPATSLGRATKGAAQALMASSSLVFANWLDLNKKTVTTDEETRDKDYYYRQAIQWSDSVILSKKYALYDDYAYLWDVANEPLLHKEVIYSIQFTIDEINSLAGSSGSEFAARYLPSNYPNGVGDQSGTGDINVAPGFINDYWTDPVYAQLGDRSNSEIYPADTVDYRLETSFLKQWLNSNGKYVHACPFPHWEGIGNDNTVSNTMNNIAKYIDPNSRDKRNSENDLNIFRLSEIYLIRAEAHAELGELTQAVDDLNVVRKRARRRGTTDDNYYPIPRLLTIDEVPDAGTFRAVLLKERGLELVGECKRWLDLIRMKSPDGTETMYTYRFRQLADQVKYPRIPPTYDRESFSWNNAGYINWDVIKRVVEYSQTPNKYLLFPLPASEVENNAMITQNNPGW